MGGTKEAGQARPRCGDWPEVVLCSQNAWHSFLSMSGMVGRQCWCLSLLSVCLDMCGPATSLHWRGDVERPIEPALCRLLTEHCRCGQDAEN